MSGLLEGGPHQALAMRTPDEAFCIAKRTLPTRPARWDAQGVLHPRDVNVRLRLFAKAASLHIYG